MKSSWLESRKKRRLQQEGAASDLRKQIDDLRAQLSRYAEAVEDDLTSGREKVADKSRKALTYQAQYLETTGVLVANLRGKAEARELLVQLGEVEDTTAKKEKAAE